MCSVSINRCLVMSCAVILELQQRLEAQDATIKELKAAMERLTESDAGQMGLLQETQ